MDGASGSRSKMNGVEGSHSVLITSEERHEPNVIVTCACDQNSEATFYCEAHHVVICQVCKTLKRTNCKTDTVKDKSVGYIETEMRSLM